MIVLVMPMTKTGFLRSGQPGSPVCAAGTDMGVSRRARARHRRCWDLPQSLTPTAISSLILLLLLLPLAACPTTGNPVYCADNDDCQLPLVCNVDGTIPGGLQNACVMPPMTPDAPMGGDCTEATQATDCTEPTLPICNAADLTCRGCISGDECAELNAATPVCNMMTGACAASGCTSNMSCVPEMPVCDMSGAAGVCVGCTPGSAGDSICATDHPDTPVCNDAGACVACVSDNECDGASTAPVCNTETNTCRGCERDGECASGICLGSGACEDPANIVYVRGDGEDDGSCTIDEPCKTITYALGYVVNDRQTIFVLGTDPIVDNVVVNKTVAIVGDGGEIAADISAGDNIPVLRIEGTVEVTLRNLSISGGRGGGGGHGIFCLGGLGDPTLAINNVIINNNAALGIDANECRLTIDRSSILDNRAGGIDISDSAFAITNSVISFNGDDLNSDVGGLKIDNGNADPQILAFNTIARNGAVSGATGVNCTAMPPVNITSNIVHLGQGAAPSLAGNCAFQYSNIRDKDTLGAIAEDGTNVDEAPTFVDLGARNFHLPANDTTCKERGQPITDLVSAIPALARDLDGDDRPQGSLPDIGADEIVGN